MPTPDEEGCVPPTPPAELPSSRASFASCPPEEEREAHAPREPRAGNAPNEHALDGHAIRQVATPEPDALPGSSQDVEEDGEKAEHVEDAGILAVSDSPPSPASSPQECGSDSDVKLAQSFATTALGADSRRAEFEDEAAPLYLYYPPSDKDRVSQSRPTQHPHQP